MGKINNITRTAKGYYHNLDPYTLHATKADAGKDRTRVYKNVTQKIRKARVSTFYTIMQDKRKNNPQKFGNVPQGPHVFPHFGLHQGLIVANKQGKLDVFSPLISTPAAFNTKSDTEIPSGHLKRPRAEIAKTIYKKRHDRFTALQNIIKVNRGEGHSIRYAHVINKLLQMHPHGSYAYKGTGAGKKFLSGKGESSLKPIANQIDLPKKHGFNDISGVTTRNQSILNTLKKI
jgi:hypothetical protein